MSERLQTESAFHDAWAEGTRLEDVNVTGAFEAITAPENRFILDRMGPLEGRAVLDIGCGLGESSVYFAKRGARVTALDLSEKMVELTSRLAHAHGVSVTGVVSAAEALNVPEGTFDFVYLGNILHHVIEGRADLLGRVCRALKPGGTFYSWDPLAYNPLINVYRAMATRVRTPDEAPLSFADVALARRHFADVGHREFWIASLALFLKYYAVDRVHPNADRYWKRILRETPATLWWWRPLAALDGVLTRLPLVRRLAWNMVMWGRRPV